MTTTTNNNQLNQNKMKIDERRSECCNATVGGKPSSPLCDLCDSYCTTYNLDDNQITIEASRHGKGIGFLCEYSTENGQKAEFSGGLQTCEEVLPHVDNVWIVEPKGYSLTREEHKDALAIAEEKWDRITEARKERACES